jgi:hypothetical protein
MAKIKEFMLQIASELGKEPNDITQEDFEKAIVEKYGIYLCKCNNCDNIYQDTNPQIGAKKYKDEGYRSLESLEDREGYCNACPDCKTDAYLVDI